MNTRVLYIGLLLIFFIYGELRSQQNCIVPDPPVLTSVSINNETGETEVRWQPSPSGNIAAYIVYAVQDGAAFKVDTIWNPSAVSYSHVTTAWKYFSLSYTVAAFRLPDCASRLSNVVNTIFCEARFDTCSGNIRLNWNSYPGGPDYPYDVTGYSILVSLNGSSFSELLTVPVSTREYLMNNAETGSEYCFIIRANTQDGPVSLSNRICVNTDMQRPPAWINADYASVNQNGHVELSFTPDPQGETGSYMLERRTGTSGVFAAVTLLKPAGGKVTYTDQKADLSKPNQYRLSAISSCNTPVALSNTASVILLSLQKRELELVISWNAIHPLTGSSMAYRIHMDTGKGFTPVATVHSDSVFVIQLRDIMYEISEGQVCFYVTGIETGNPHGVDSESRSTLQCIANDEVITVPNIFTPNNDLQNDRFRPVLSFTPKEYRLTVTDRQGKVLFESGDFMEDWDGSGAASGVYLWFLRLQTPSGKKLSRSGTVTVFLP